MQTLKLKYYVDEESSKIIKEFRRQYSICLHYMFNRVLEGYKETEIKHMEINNIPLINSWFKQSCVKESIQLLESRKTIECSPKKKKETEEQYQKRLKLFEEKRYKLIFGSRKSFNDLKKGLISIEEFKEKRLAKLYSIGNKTAKFGNVKFEIGTEEIIFKPNRNLHISLRLSNVRPNYRRILRNLYKKSINKEISISYKLDNEFVYISFEEEELYKESKLNYGQVSNRVLALDLNPNYIGWSIVDWKSSDSFELIKSGIFIIKELNDIEDNLNVKSIDPRKIKIANKRKFELLEISKKLINICLYYKCQIFSVENLNIKSKDNNKGSNFNKLVNIQWNRNIFINNLRKRCNIFGIKFIQVKPEYSSFIGNILYRSIGQPDMILSSIETGRRGYEFYNQYVSKAKAEQKNIVFPDLSSNLESLYLKSLEEIKQRDRGHSWKQLYSSMKSKKLEFRLKLSSDMFEDLEFSSFSSTKSHVRQYNSNKSYIFA